MGTCNIDGSYQPFTVYPAGFSLKTKTRPRRGLYHAFHPEHRKGCPRLPVPVRLCGSELFPVPQEQDSLAGTGRKSDPYNTPGTLEYAAQQVQDRVNKALSSGGN